MLQIASIFFGAQKMIMLIVEILHVCVTAHTKNLKKPKKKKTIVIKMISVILSCWLLSLKVLMTCAY